MVATKNNPSEDRIILARFFRYPRIGPKYTYKKGKSAKRSALGCLLRWLLDVTIPLENPDANYHSFIDFGDELGFSSRGHALRVISTLAEPSVEGEVFVQLSFWIEEIFGYRDEEGTWHGPIIKPDELVTLSNLDDPKGIAWMAVAAKIQNHVKGTMRSRGLKV